MSQLLEVKPTEQKIRIILDGYQYKLNTDKPLYRFNWDRNGWEEIIVYHAGYRPPVIPFINPKLFL